PTLAFSLVGGTIADRTDRRAILIATQSALMLLALLLALLALRGALTAWQILAVALVTGVAVALNSPAYQAIIPSLVPREELTRAIALNSVQFNVARIIGHSVAGLAVAALGAPGCFFLNGISYGAMLYALWRLRPPPGHLAGDRSRFWHRACEGLRYVRGQGA